MHFAVLGLHVSITNVKTGNWGRGVMQKHRSNGYLSHMNRPNAMRSCAKYTEIRQQPEASPAETGLLCFSCLCWTNRKEVLQRGLPLLCTAQGQISALGKTTYRHNPRHTSESPRGLNTFWLHGSSLGDVLKLLTGLTLICTLGWILMLASTGSSSTFFLPLLSMLSVFILIKFWQF